MDKAATKSRNRWAVLQTETRCVYCPHPPATIEHMPPLAMFRNKLRPSGLEFAACADCNNGTRSADIAACFMARLIRDGETDSQLIREAMSLRSKLAFRAPGVLTELFDPDKSADVHVMTLGGLLVWKKGIKADGPRLKAHLDVFSAKLGMALYREHVGAPLPVVGAVFSMWFLNAGLAQENAEVLLRMMPNAGTLRQGRMNVADQFAYRYNCDEETIVAALASFHGGLHVFTIATAEPEKYPLTGTGPTGSLIRPGGLLAHLPSMDGLVPLLRRGHPVRMPRP